MQFNIAWPGTEQMGSGIPRRFSKVEASALPNGLLTQDGIQEILEEETFNAITWFVNFYMELLTLQLGMLTRPC